MKKILLLLGVLIGLQTVAGAEPAKSHSLSKPYTKRVAVEEFTGTGCGFCPRGLIGMQLLREYYGDKFVGIGLHWYNSNDYMYLEKSRYASVSFTGAPMARINRGNAIDPYYGSAEKKRGIFTDFEKALAEAAPVGVEVSGKFNQDFGATVTATATIESETDAAYRLEFVVIADSVFNVSKKQHNYYYQYNASEVGPDLELFAAGGTYGTATFAWAFDDVAIGSSYSNNVNKQPDIQLKANEPQDFTITMTMPEASSELAQSMDYGKVAVIALVIDKSTNRIVNCAKSAYLDQKEYSGSVTFCDAEGASISSLTASTAMNSDMEMCGPAFGITNNSNEDVTAVFGFRATTLSSGSAALTIAGQRIELTAKGERKEVTITVPANGRVMIDSYTWMPQQARTGNAEFEFDFEGKKLSHRFIYSKSSYPFAFCKVSGTSLSIAPFTYRTGISKLVSGKVVLEDYGIKNQNALNASTGRLKVSAESLPSGKFYLAVEGKKLELTGEGQSAEVELTIEKTQHTLFSEAYWQPAEGIEASDAVITFATGDRLFTVTFQYEGSETSISGIIAVDDKQSTIYNIAGQRVSGIQKGLHIKDNHVILK